ncbi:hypothetical protein ACFVZM_06865 [Streptomyces sioyaensis]|uniref:hypothetical protein n=1 Tax=Streptomyces sioyaensis TaxID=67364 RepID=UPI0036BE0525
MSTTSAHQTCNHPARDVAIVGLSSAVVSLAATIVVMAFSGPPLAIFGAGGSTFVAAISAGMNILSHIRRNA